MNARPCDIWASRWAFSKGLNSSEHSGRSHTHAHTHTQTHTELWHTFKILNSDDLFFLLHAPREQNDTNLKKKTKQNDKAHLFYCALFRMKNRNKNDSVDIQRVEKKI